MNRKPCRACRPRIWADHYTRKAKQEHFPARSVYKLKEIQEKHRLLRPGDQVLDLGCFPGSWLLYAAGIVGPRGRVCGVDLKPVVVALPPGVRAVTGDILAMDETALTQLGSGFTVVLSDMAPDTTGNKLVDASRSLDLCRAALRVALAVLVPGGHFICKIFQGEDFKAFADGLRPLFKKVDLFKPQSCRKASKEIYIIAMNKSEEATYVRT